MARDRRALSRAGGRDALADLARRVWHRAHNRFVLQHWGKGFVPEATRAIIHWSFQQLSIYRIYATTDVENVASQRVLEKVGMQCEGILRKYIIHPNISDIPRDSYMYAITK